MSGVVRPQRPGSQVRSGPAQPAGGSAGRLAASIHRLQRAAGNRAVATVLARQPNEPVPATGWRRRVEDEMTGEHLHLDPKIEDEVRLALSGLSTEEILESLAATPRTLLPARAPRPRTDPAPPPYPPGPPGFHDPAQSASYGAFLSTVKRVPEVKRALGNLEDQVWGRLSSGDQTTLLTTSITFGAAALGGFLATPGGRDLLGRLSGVPLPVPAVPWLSLEFSSRNDVIGLGVHVDVGDLLSGRLGFGTASPRDPDPSLYDPPR
jgi:hypothetical protein